MGDMARVARGGVVLSVLGSIKKSAGAMGRRVVYISCLNKRKVCCNYNLLERVMEKTNGLGEIIIFFSFAMILSGYAMITASRGNQTTGAICGIFAWLSFSIGLALAQHDGEKDKRESSIVH